MIALVLVLLFTLAGLSLTPGGGEEEVVEAASILCEPGTAEPPCTAGVESGVPYPIALEARCGIEWAYLDGRYWIVSPETSPPPEGQAAVVTGTVVFLGEDDALFAADDSELFFSPAPEGYRPPPCG